MIADARELAADEVLAADVCIVGSGPAGLTVAKELLGAGLRICLLESGGLDTDPATQSLSELELGGDWLQVEDDARNRRLGGNSAAWSIQLPGGGRGPRHRPLDEVDFERRDWVPDSGWPFGRDLLVPYYERAHAALGMGPFAYDGADWADAGHPCLPLDDGRVTTRAFQFSLGQVLHQAAAEQVMAAPGTTTLLHATVAEVEVSDDGGRVTGVRIARPDGTSVRVEARHVVLAAGGLETAQLLLSSDGVHAGGLGNANDLVGRYFMDHPVVSGGVVVPANRGLFARARLYDLREVRGSFVMGLLGLTSEAVAADDLLNISTVLFPRSRHVMPLPAVAGLRSLASGRAFRDGTWASASVDAVRASPRLLNRALHKARRGTVPPWYDFFRGGWSETVDAAGTGFDVFEVVHQVEQLPDRDNRVLLSDRRDALGRRRLRIETRWRDVEVEGVQRSQQVVAEAVARSGIGSFVVATDPDGRPVLRQGGTAHHLGTTRMHADPRHGVVDAECRLHGVPNLFVASSSVFPTGGYANPTLTIVALAIRIADRLKLELGRGAVAEGPSAAGD